MDPSAINYIYCVGESQRGSDHAVHPDLTTSNAAQGVIVTAIRNQRIQWEQDSADLACDGRLSNALILEQWEFAAGLLETMVSNECSVLFGRALDALAVELASAQDPIPAFRS